MNGHLIRDAAIAVGLLTGVAGVAFADTNKGSDVDIKLATRYCEAAQASQGRAVDAEAMTACMREFGYSSFRFGAGARF